MSQNATLLLVTYMILVEPGPLIIAARQIQPILSGDPGLSEEKQGNIPVSLLRKSG